MSGPDEDRIADLEEEISDLEAERQDLNTRIISDAVEIARLRNALLDAYQCFKTGQFEGAMDAVATALNLPDPAK